jgi:hypothetical protein
MNFQIIWLEKTGIAGRKIFQRLDKEDIPVAIVSARYGFLVEDLATVPGDAGKGLEPVGLFLQCFDQGRYLFLNGQRKHHNLYVFLKTF